MNDEILQKLQKCQLQMLDHFIDICDKYHLNWCSDAGTTLGAIRHGGMIPWDDDIDIMMPRKDYNVMGEIVGYQYLFDCIRQYKCRNKLNPLTESELNIFKIVFKEYIETCAGIWGDQSEAIKYINEHRSEFCDLYVSDNNKENENKEINKENTLTSMSQDFTIAIENTPETELEPVETISYFNPKKYKTDKEFWAELNKPIEEPPKEQKIPKNDENTEFFKKLSEY